MKVICADANVFALIKLRKQMREIFPEADVYGCMSPKEVKKLAVKVGCDVLLTEIDFGFHKSEGLNLAQEMKSMYPHVNIILATSGSLQEYAMHIIKLRISGFLIKPYTNEELKEEIMNLRFSEAQTAEVPKRQY